MRARASHHSLLTLYAAFTNRSEANTACSCWVTIRRYSLFCFISSTTPPHSQDQQIVLNYHCPIRISDADTILRPAIRITARADNQFRQSVADPLASVLRNLIFVPSGIFTYIFTACSPSAFELVMIKLFGSLTTFLCQEKDVADISLAIDSA